MLSRCKMNIASYILIEESPDEATLHRGLIQSPEGRK